MEVKKIVESSFVHLLIIFTIVVLLNQLGMVHAWDINLKLFAYILPLFAIPALLALHKKKPSVPSARLVQLILLILFLTVFAARMVPYMENDIPLGYDPGFYKHIIDTYNTGLPDIPEEALPLWIKQGFPQGLFVLSSQLWLFTGATAEQLEVFFFPALCAFLVLPIFLLARQIFNTKIALIAVVLYTASYAQYTMFTLMYFKNIIGLILLLLALYSLEKKNYWLLTLMWAGLGIYHRPEFLLFSLVAAAHFIHRALKAREQQRSLILSASATAALISPFWLPRLWENLEVLGGVLGATASSIVGTPIGGGTFFDYSVYEWVSLAYLPFALIGFLYLLTKRKFNSLFLYFIINSAIVVFQLFFFKRMIIPLDILFIILAAAGIGYALLGSKVVPARLGAVAAVVLVVSSSIVTAGLAASAAPLTGQEQLDSIRSLNSTEPDAFVMTNSIDAPWVLAYSQRRVIAPGLFEHDRHNETEWRAFFATDDIEETRAFMDTYDKPIYIYGAGRLGAEKFGNECFEDMGNAILKYAC